MTNQQQPAATAGQPTGVTIDPTTAQWLQTQGIPIPGQPIQQVFQQPVQNPPPANTMAAMGQGNWQVQGQATHQIPNMQFNAMPYQGQQRVMTAAQTAAANGQTEPGSPLERQTLQSQLQQFDGLVTRAIDEGVERRLEQMGIFGGQQQGAVPQQQIVNGQVQQPFFDTTTGKVVIGVGGVGVGAIGYKIMSNIFGGGGNSCSASDMNALGNAFKCLLSR